jgi:hypothetical protein
MSLAYFFIRLEIISSFWKQNCRIIFVLLQYMKRRRSCKFRIKAVLENKQNLSMWTRIIRFGTRTTCGILCTLHETEFWCFTNCQESLEVLRHDFCGRTLIHGIIYGTVLLHVPTAPGNTLHPD